MTRFIKHAATPLIAAAFAVVAIDLSGQTQPPAAPQAPQTPFRAGVDLVSLNVTVADGTARYVTDLTADDFNVFEDGVKQEVTFFNRTNLPIALALLVDTSASMEAKLPTAQEAAVGFAKKLRPQDLAEIVDFDSRVVVLQNFTNTVLELEQAIRKTSAGGSTSLYNAIYIALKDLKKVMAKNVDEIRRQAIIVLSDGEDTSSLLPFEEVLDLAKRSETAIYSIGLRSSDNMNSSSKGFKEAEFVLRQFSQETGGRWFFPNQLSDLSNVYGQIADELSSQYTVGYTSRNGKRDGSWRRGRPGDTPELDGPNKAGILRTNVALGSATNLIPLFLYGAALVAYVWHFARRAPAVGRAATTLLVAAAVSHTFVIGMVTMEVGHVPVTSATSAISTFVWLLTLSYLYTEMTTDERAMGVFILPLLVALQTIPALRPGIEDRAAVLQGPLFGLHVSSLLFAYASFALACVIGITYVLLFTEIKAKHLGFFYARLPSLQVLDRMNHRAIVIGWVFLTLGIVVGVVWAAQARAGFGAGDPRVQAMSLQDPKIFVALVCWAIYSFELFAARRIGWGGRRSAYLSALGFCIVLLNFVPISYFLTRSHDF